MALLHRLANAIPLLVVAFGCPGADTSTPVELTGLWRAQARFGADVRGTLVISKTGTGYLSDVLGHRAPVRMESGEFRFELPHQLGQFRGKLEGRDILGHWYQFGTPVNGAGRTLPVAVTPLLLRPQGQENWWGKPDPLTDVFTFFLLLKELRPDGSLSAVLRNPEFDFGTQQGVERLVVDGKALKLIGKRQDKEREVGVGIYDAENDVITLNFPSRGGKYEFRREGTSSEFHPRARQPVRYVYHPPPQLPDGWQVSDLESENIDRAAVERFIQKFLDMPMDSADAPQIHSVLIARNGKLVLEEYFHGEHRDKPHMTRSASKSVTAILAGAVMQAGAPLKPSSPVYQVMNGGSFPADLEPQKRAMTLEHLLTMSSGFFCDDNNDDAPGNEEKMWDQADEPDFYRYTLNVPLATPPGEKAVYCSCSPNLALGMVARATQEFPVYSFDRLIARPMKMGKYTWLLDPAGNPYGGGGSSFLPRDFLKFGQLLLNGGTWEGQRILSREFVHQMTARHYHLANIYYGYNWWSQDFPYKDRTVNSYLALGAGGQVIAVVPELKLVVAFYAGNYISRVQLDFGHHYIPRWLLPAVREKGDDRNAPVVEREFRSPYGRSPNGARVARPN